jgi:hypothetical protein
MSTHATIKFTDNEFVEANIYIHYDGYESNILPMLDRFYNWNEDLVTEIPSVSLRYDDAAYLAARFVHYFTTKELTVYNGLGIGIGLKEDCGHVYHIQTRKNNTRPNIITDGKYY